MERESKTESEDWVCTWLFAGALTAGGMAKGPGLASGLWLAMGVKAVVTGTLFFWGEKKSAKEVD